jgi:putative phosphoribosyl transferase
VASQEDVRVVVGDVSLAGILTLPPRPAGLVVFAHGSGSGRRSPRNQAVADVLVAGDLGTLLMDLLTEDEEAEDAVTRRLRFDIALLARRVAAAVDWAADLPSRVAGPSVGCFGASTGAAAALIAAAQRPERVAAVVSRGGRPDLAGDALPRVAAPTLLIVGERDAEVLRLNREAQAELAADSHLEIVPGATHLFEEAGALERVAALARDWFRRHLSQRTSHGA